jgi:two-component system, chemotaxis family, chemotaxis protein CheY
MTALVVDDSPTIRQMATIALAEIGFDVVHGGSGEEGLRCLDGREFDVIVADLVMPAPDGIGLVREARTRAAYRATPILVLSTDGSESRKQEGRRAGATGWIVKPFDPRLLQEAVRRVVPQSRGR